MNILLLLTAALVTLAQTQKCPEVDYLKNFNLTAYAQGVWYEIARYNNAYEKYGNCVVTNYTKRGEDDYVVEVNEVEDKKLLVYDGLINLYNSDHLRGIVNYMFLDGKTSFNLVMTFLAVDYNSYVIKYACDYDPITRTRTDGKSTYNLAMSFLAVDYTNYAIKYACKIDPNTKARVEMAWIFSRTNQLSDSAKAAVDKYLSSSTLLDKSKFFYDGFSDESCKFTSSSIDRTLPKRMLN